MHLNNICITPIPFTVSPHIQTEAHAVTFVVYIMTIAISGGFGVGHPRRSPTKGEIGVYFKVATSLHNLTGVTNEYNTLLEIITESGMLIPRTYLL